MYVLIKLWVVTLILFHVLEFTLTDVDGIDKILVDSSLEVGLYIYTIIVKLLL